MIVTIGYLNKKLTLRKLLTNWILVYLSNFAGCVFFAYVFAYLTNIFAEEPYRSYVQSVAVSKTHEGWGVLFIKGIVANTLVCMGYIFAAASRDAGGKILAAWFPPVCFVLMGMEHVIANQFFVNIGLMYGADTTAGLMWFNQSAAGLGNIVGGGLVLAGSEHLLNHWKSPLPWHAGHPRGSLFAHDVESTRRAKDPYTPPRVLTSPEIATPNAEKDNMTLTNQGGNALHPIQMV